MSKAETNYRAWLAKADEDLLNIDNNIDAERVPWSTICFHAQQAGEKVLKAFLVYHKQRPKKTHDLVILLTKCAEIESGLVDLEGDCDLLTTHAVDSRYPDDFHMPDAEEGHAADDAGRRVRDRLALLPDKV